MIRALAWVLGGFVTLALIVVATAPELTEDAGVAGGFAVLAFAAAVPGVVLLLVLAITRRGRHDEPGAGRPTRPARSVLPSRRANLTPEDLRAARQAEASSDGSPPATSSDDRSS